ncbi:MAG: 30S ribosomal protein S4 [Planctomycetota bacterium]|jgi:small subunit ribosomal protein S4|nr:30S ribosomal protein S4 [Planctomycetota bacterium]
MARYTVPVCRKCRRAGMKLYLKGVRCETAKCPIEKQWRNKPPGMHFWQRRRPSEYGVRLREKQKLRWYYGVLERQFRQFLAEAQRSKGSTGETLLVLMERRLDNAVYRLGFTPSRKTARQVINHGHIQVNGRTTNVPSLKVRAGDVIEVRNRKSSRALVGTWLVEEEGRMVPQWLSADQANFRGDVKALPSREDISLQINEQLIVEFCSR